MKNDEIYQAKQVWLERVMASSLTPAQKVFAFSIYKRAYGLKVSSFPGPKDIVEDTHLTPGKFSEHRKALFACGALSGVKSRQASGTQDNYTYTLMLEWDGTVPPTDTTVTPMDMTVTPEGETLYPTGGSNTTINTTKKTTRKTTKEGASVAVAPSLPNNELREDKGMKIESWSCVPEGDKLPVLENGITYFLTGEGVTKVDDSLASNDEWVTAPRTPKKEKKTPASVVKQAAGKSVKDRSATLLKKKLEEAASKKDFAVKHLENTITKSRLTDAQAQQARDWFANNDWEPNRQGGHRAAYAVFKASEIEDVA